MTVNRLKKLIAVTTFLTCLVAIMLTGLYSDLYYSNSSRDIASIETKNSGSEYLNIDLKNIQAVLFKNRVSNFKLEKILNKWFLTQPSKSGTPQNLPVKEIEIKQILNFTKNITAKKEFHETDVNLKNLSMDNPLFEIVYIDSFGKRMAYRVGINNSLDQSTYIYSPHIKKVLKVDSVSPELTVLTFDKLLSPNIINFDEKNISSLKLSETSKLTELKIVANLRKSGEKWYNSQDQEIEKQKFIAALDEIASIKSSLIFDPSDLDELTGFADNKANSQNKLTPLFAFEISGNDSKVFSYTFHQISKDIPHLNIDRKKNIIVESSLHNSVFVIAKTSLKSIESVRESYLKKLKLKDIFY
jgi:hypothetical protein